MKLSALNRKLLRDLMTMKGQALAIAMVVAAGVSMYVMYLSNFASLQQTRAASLLVALGRESGEHEFSLVVEEEMAALVLHGEGIPEERLLPADQRERFPAAISRGGVETPQLAHAAQAVDVATANHRCPEDRMQAFTEVAHLRASTIPHDLRGGGRALDLKHQRALVE